MAKKQTEEALKERDLLKEQFQNASANNEALVQKVTAIGQEMIGMQTRIMQLDGWFRRMEEYRSLCKHHSTDAPVVPSDFTSSGGHVYHDRG